MGLKVLRWKLTCYCKQGEQVECGQLGLKLASYFSSTEV